MTDPQIKLDGFINALNGLGTSKDPTITTSYSATYSDFRGRVELEELYRKEGLAARIVEVLPKEMLKKGIQVLISSNTEVQADLADQLKKLKFVKQLQRALILANLYGGGALLMGINDGRKPDAPVDLTKIQSVDWVNVLSCNRLTPLLIDTDPMSPTFDQVLTYQISGDRVSIPVVVHASRLLRFMGVELPTEMSVSGGDTVDGWGDSVLHRVWDPVRRFVSSMSSIEVMVKDFHQTTIKLKQLVELLGTGPNDQEELVKARLQLMIKTKSIFNAFVIDQEDAVTSSSPTVTGLDKLFELMILHLASVSQTPVTKLFGRSPAGMNATGESDEQSWIELVVASAEALLREPVEAFVEILLAAKKGPSMGEILPFSVVFPPPNNLTAIQAVTVRKMQAEVDAVYLEREVVTSEEITQSRFGGSDYSTTTNLNHDLREEQALGALEIQDTTVPQPEDGVDLRDLAKELNMRDTGPLRRMGKAGRFPIWRAGRAIIASRRQVLEAMQSPAIPVTEVEPIV